MPLNKEALPLDASPSAVAQARRWVVQVCQELGRDDLVDCAELGVSELVTNAMLHGEGPMNVRVRGTRDHPRVEVFDSSLRPPVLPDPIDHSDPSDESFLTTFGRGLDLVAKASTAWGAHIETGGKIVWFEPAGELRDVATPGTVASDSDADVDWEPLPDSIDVRLVDVDVPLFVSILNQYSNLRRELRLLALAHDNDYPVARDLSSLFSTFERQFRPAMLNDVARHVREGHKVTDLKFTASLRSVPIFRTMFDMFALADNFCENQRLLSLARTPEQVRMQQWLLDEFVHQADGAEPTSWHEYAGSRQLHDAI